MPLGQSHTIFFNPRTALQKVAYKQAWQNVSMKFSHSTMEKSHLQEVFFLFLGKNSKTLLLMLKCQHNIHKYWHSHACMQEIIFLQCLKTSLFIILLFHIYFLISCLTFIFPEFLKEDGWHETIHNFKQPVLDPKFLQIGSFFVPLCSWRCELHVTIKI